MAEDEVVEAEVAEDEVGASLICDPTIPVRVQPALVRAARRASQPAGQTLAVEVCHMTM